MNKKTKLYLQYNAIYIKFKSKQNWMLFFRNVCKSAQEKLGQNYCMRLEDGLLWPECVVVSKDLWAINNVQFVYLILNYLPL